MSDVVLCQVCGRKLTDPKSVKEGVGPGCKRKLRRIFKDIDKEKGDQGEH